MTNYAVSVVLRAVNQATGPIRQFAEQLASLNAPARAAAKSLAASGVQDSLASAARAAGRLSSSIGAVGDRLRGLLGPAAAVSGALSIAGVVRLATGYARAGDEIERTAVRLGIGIERLQELRAAAQLGGASAEQLDGSLERLQKALTDAATGQSDSLAALFYHLKIETRDATHQIRNAADVLPELAEAFRINDNQGVREKMGDALGVKDLIPLLAQGKGALSSYIAEAHRLGVVLDQSAVKAAAEFEQESTKLNLSLDGLRNSIGAELLPVLKPIIEAMREWIVANRELVGTRAKEAIEAIRDAFADISLTDVLEGVTAFFRGLKSVAEFVGGWKVALVGLVAIMNAGLLVSLITAGKELATFAKFVGRAAFQLGALALAQTAGAVGNFITAIRAGYGVMAAFNLVLAANPIGAVIIGLTALAAAAYLIYEYWTPIKAAVVDAWNSITGAVGKGTSQAVGAIVETWESIKSAVTDGIAAVINAISGFDLFEVGAQLLGGLVEGIKSILPTFNSILRPISGVIETVKGIFSSDRVGAGGGGDNASRSGGSLAVATARAGGVASGIASAGKMDVNVRFENAPRGTRIETQSRGAEPDVAVGYSFAEIGGY